MDFIIVPKEDVEITLVLQALFRTKIPANCGVLVSENSNRLLHFKASFYCPRRFAAWALRNGYIKHPKDRALVARYVRS